MGNKSYRFKVGAFECIIVHDGAYTCEHPARVFFSDVPQEHLAQVLHEHDIDLAQWTEYATPLLRFGPNGRSKDFGFRFDGSRRDMR